ncbi:MAG: tRNA pseudouridine(55) synthase TruB [Planctomycetota bacterium]|jgi:tRNA pseudouridine55 synthase|nr:tRNA pseudouridine(55) synthase TruB [Planctomycetota bacterium]
MGRRPRYKGTPIHGLLVVDKPLGVGSTEVVRRVRYAAGDVKTGHAGTLDPLASGVVICCLGNATKSVEALMGQTKVYETAIDLSGFTATDDAEAEVEPVACAQAPDRSAVDAVLAQHLGTIMQTPPAYSALKLQGKPAYERVRAGEKVELAARPVRIDAIEVQRYQWPYLEVVVTCGRGTYLRSLARSVGEALGTGGYLRGLRRTAVGPYCVENATPLDALPDPVTQDHLLPAPVAER